MTHWTAAPGADYDAEENPAVAAPRTGPTSTIRGALIAGFAVVFVLWGASGYELFRSLREVDRRLEASRDDFQRGQDVLTTVRTNVLLGSVYLRDALIDRTPSSYDDYRAALLKIRDDVDRILRGVAHAKARRRQTVARHEILRERLARFERRGRFRRTDDGLLLSREQIDDTATERHLRSDHGEINGLPGRDGEQLRWIALVRRKTPRDLRDPGVARNAQ